MAALPTFIEFSINAQGYALQWLSVLAVMLFDKVLQENPSLKVGWRGFISAAVVGVYSIPTTLIAIAGVFARMLLSTLADGEVSKLKGTSKKIALARLAIAMLSVLLFVALLLVRGPGAVMAKDVVSWQQDDFVEGVKHMGQCAWLHWTERVPGGVLWILFGGLAIGLLFRCKVCEHRVSGHSVSMSMALWLSAAMFCLGVPRFRFSSGGELTVAERSDDGICRAVARAGVSWRAFSTRPTRTRWCGVIWSGGGRGCRSEGY
jgi:hypothetical protein